MQVTFKTIKQESFQVEIDDDETISNIKQKLSTEKGYVAENTKLIYSGKVLGDEMKFAEVKFEEKKFIVVMESKPKPASVSAPTTSEPVAATATAPPVAATIVQGSTPIVAPESALVVGPELDAMVAQIMQMGFDRDSVMTALRASYFNPDRAVEYLINGAPPVRTAPQVAAVASAPPAAVPTHNTVDAVATSTPIAGADMSALVNNPQFAQLRQMVRANPALLEPMIQALAQTQPELVQMITQNQEAFIAMLNSEEDGGGLVDDDDDELGGGGAAGGGTVVQLTPEEHAAIESMKNMGFPEGLCVEAYLACDKDYNMAINYILARMDEFDADLG